MEACVDAGEAFEVAEVVLGHGAGPFLDVGEERRGGDAEKVVEVAADGFGHVGFVECEHFGLECAADEGSEECVAAGRA